ncbi:unnamed protein product [Hymenolepis diminuta]|uniref:Uncharacterized protein n=1 Tax=Hymenolepis diminuta TaxID=6216 RepID=A0A564YP98_HYMDI|nr:unnamed protein product [Hymenolepis diminuta]
MTIHVTGCVPMRTDPVTSEFLDFFSGHWASGEVTVLYFHKPTSFSFIPDILMTKQTILFLLNLVLISLLAQSQERTGTLMIIIVHLTIDYPANFELPIRFMKSISDELYCYHSNRKESYKPSVPFPSKIVGRFKSQHLEVE